jgi:ribosomal protein S19E (S16A)
MAKVYDVPADVLIERLANILKNEDIPAPSWTPFVKTGAHADKPPQDSEWWYTRCASIMRKNNIKMVKPELSDLVEQYIIGMATQGKMPGQINDDQLKQILLSTQQPKRDFKINRV